MSSKKAVRKHRAEREQERRASPRRGTRILVVLTLVAALIVLAAALLFGPGSAARNAGQVWSAEHGHWHNR